MGSNNDMIRILGAGNLLVGVAGLMGYIDFGAVLGLDSLPYDPEMLYWLFLVSGFVFFVLPFLTPKHHYKSRPLHYDSVPFSGITLKTKETFADRCQYCKAKVKSEDTFCKRCGAPV